MISRKDNIFNFLMYLVIAASCGAIIYVLALDAPQDSMNGNPTSSVLTELEVQDSILTTMSIDKMIKDFGVLYNDTTVSAEFRLVNTGKDTLRIHYINVDCNCTTFEISNNNIPPLDTAILKYTVDTREKIGRHNLVTTFAANTDRKFYKLTLKMDIKRSNKL